MTRLFYSVAEPKFCIKAGGHRDPPLQFHKNNISVTIIPITAGVPPIADAASVYPLREMCSPVTSPRALTAKIAPIPCNALSTAQEKKRFVLNAETITITQATARDAITPNFNIPDKFITSGIYMKSHNKKCRQTVLSLSAFVYFIDS